MPKENGTTSLPNQKTARRSHRKDALVLDAQQEAFDAISTIARPEAIGEYTGASMAGERLALHRFTCLEEGYPGWFWEVSLARAPRTKKVTVCEINLVPGPGALLAPPWIPWRERLEPDDVSRSDVLPYDANDERLQPSFESMEAEEVVVDVEGPIGYGRPRTLSQHGMDETAQRWYSSPRGKVPGTKPEAMCANCGFLLKIKGPMGRMFGVCANEWSPDDGMVVSLDHTCGSHSETDQPKRRSQWPTVESRLDDYEVEIDHTWFSKDEADVGEPATEET